MLDNFFNSQMDYIIFLAGLGPIILTAVCSMPKTPSGPRLPWLNIARFCFLYGISEWLKICVHGFGGNIYLSILQTSFLFSASLYLIEFGRSICKERYNKGVGKWILFPLSLAALTGYFFDGFIGLNVSIRYFLCLVGGVWAAYAVFLLSKDKNIELKNILRLVCAAMASHAFLNGVIVPKAHFFPASIINQDTFYQLVKVPIVAFRCVLFFSGVAICWLYTVQICKLGYGPQKSRQRLYLGVWTGLLIGAIVASGWFFTNIAQSKADKTLRHNIMVCSKISASALNGAFVKKLTGTGNDTKNNPYFNYIRKHLQNIHKANKDCRFIYLMGLRGKNVVFLADSENVNSNSYSPPGSIYKEASQSLKSAFYTGEYFTEGPLVDKWGSWLSGLSPIRDQQSNRVIAVLGMDYNAKIWSCEIAKVRTFCIALIGLVCSLVIMFFIAFQNEQESNMRLSKSEERYRNLVECSPNWLTVCNQDANCVSINRSGLDAMQWQPKDVVGKQYLRCWPEHVRDTVQNAIKQVLNGKQCSFEADSVDAYGDKISWHVILDPIQASNYKIDQFVSIATNVTGYKKASEELRIRASAINAASDQIIITDVHGNIKFVNLAFERETGYTWDEAVGNNPRILKSGKHTVAFYKNLWGTILKGKTWHGEIINRRKDGNQCVEDVTITPVKNDKKIIEHFIAIKRNVTEKKIFEQKLNHLAHHDHLTGLPNRLLFSDRLKQEISEAHKDGRQLSVMFIDLDHFKKINDTLGHSTGDLLLKTAADRLIKCLRETDTLARMGGDEFTVILPDVSTTEASGKIAQRILESLSEPFMLDNRELFISASIGISAYPSDGTDVETLVKNADTAMYRAKEQGRNNCQLYTESLYASAMDKMNLEADLRKAIERKELVLYYQPRVDFNRGMILGMEALLRWEHPKYGLISPIEFIPLAEETGLIIPISEMVLRTACIQNKTWQDAGLPAVNVAVNISARSFERGDLVGTVRQVLSDTGLAPEYLELELTESTLMGNPEYACDVLNEIKSMGVKVAVDDFGTGYSSLSYLKKLPIDTVKIDQSFVKDITTNNDDAAIAGAVVAMAHSLKLRVIAEGVETLEQIEFLRSFECDEIQGYFISRPVPTKEFEQLLSEEYEQVSWRNKYAA